MLRRPWQPFRLLWRRGQHEASSSGAGVARVPSRWLNASAQAREAQYPGAKLAVIAAGILNVGDVAFCPIHRAVRRVLGPSMQPLSSDGVTAQLRSAGGTSPR